MEQRSFSANTTQDWSKATILVVDEDEHLRELLTTALRLEGSYTAYAVSHSQDALHFTRSVILDLVIIDYELSEMTGLQLYDRMHEGQAAPFTPGILLSPPFSSSLLKPRPLWGVQEPFDIDRFLSYVERIISFARQQKLNEMGEEVEGEGGG